MKRLLCIVLLFALCCTVLYSCKREDPSDNESSESAADDAAYKDENGRYRSRLEVKDFDSKEFKILVMGEAFATYQSEDFTTESTLYGDLLNDAVEERNNKIEQDYNVKLVVIKSDTIGDDIRNEAVASTGAYDAIMPSLRACAIYAQNNYLYDLTRIGNFDLDAPWWDSNATESLSIDNKVFFTTGDITILNKVCTLSVLFNKEMIADYGLENPYELVENKQWTFDKMVEMGKAVTQINSPDGSISADNIYGMLTGHADPLYFYGAAGELICGKDANDLPYFTLDGERAITVAQKVLSTLQEGDWCVFAQDFEPPIWDTSFETFHQGRALFRPSAFSATTKARQRSELEFGIIPLPLWDSSQDNYRSYAGTGAIAGVAIPLSCDDPEFSAYMLDIYAAEAKNTITPAYYEINLKMRDARDDESVEMLDIIFDNIVYDVGEVYNFGSIVGIFAELMSNNSTDIVSQIDALKDTINSDIDKTIENYGS